MKNLNTKIIVTLLACCTLLIAMWILSYTFINRNQKIQTIEVKGMSKKEFKANQAVWNVTVKDKFQTTFDGFHQIDEQTNKVLEFLKSNGVNDEQISVQGLIYSTHYNQVYDKRSDSYISEADGFMMSKSVIVTSSDVDKIDKLSNSITKLLSEGVMVEYSQPSFYYTRLADLKLKMLSEAANDAYNRAKEIAESSGSHVGKLKSSSMGVFQILGKYSNDDYSWGGTFNTTSKEKVGTITVSSSFFIK